MSKFRYGVKLSTILLLLYLFFAIIFIAEPILVLANSEKCPDKTICIDNPLKYETIDEVIKAITNLLKTIAIPIGVAMVVWGGIQVMTASGSEERATKGKKTIMWAVIGVAIVVGMDLIVGLIKEFLK